MGHKVIYENDKTTWIYNKMQLNQNIHGRNLRRLNFQTTTNYFLPTNKITEKASIVWNDLNPIIKVIDKRQKFKSKIQYSYLNSYD